MQQIVRNSNPSFFNFLFKITFFLLLTSNLNGQNKLVYGIERTDQYIKFLSDKKIGLVTNHTSKFYVNKPIHLVDSLINRVEHDTSGEDNIKSLSLVFNSYKSNKLRKEIKF